MRLSKSTRFLGMYNTDGRSIKLLVFEKKREQRTNNNFPVLQITK